MAAYPAVLARGLLAWSLGDVGEFVEGRQVAEDTIRLADMLDQPFSQSVSRTWLGYFYVGQGDLSAAISVLEQCRALVERWDLPRLGLFAASLLGVAHAMGGRLTESISHLEQAAAHLDPTQGGGAETRLLITLCDGFLLAGRHEEAAQLTERTLDHARLHNERGYEAQALRLLADIAARRDPPDAREAEARYREAKALAADLAMRPLEARCHLGLGKLYRRAGRVQDANVELSSAVKMLRTMEMTFWLPEAERELAELTQHQVA